MDLLDTDLERMLQKYDVTLGSREYRRDWWADPRGDRYWNGMQEQLENVRTEIGESVLERYE